MSKPKSGRIALLFVEGERLIDCRLADHLPEIGSAIELFERDTHVRSTERCSRPCCAHEPVAPYVVDGLADKGAGWDGLNAAIADRDWEEGKCTRHEWCNLFDSYSLAGYLRLEPPFEDMPERVVLIEVKRS